MEEAIRTGYRTRKIVLKQANKYCESLDIFMVGKEYGDDKYSGGSFGKVCQSTKYARMIMKQANILV